MRIGTAAWGMRNLPPEEKFALTQKLGLSLMELSIAGYPTDFLQADATDAHIGQMRRWSEKYSVSLECACAGNDFTSHDLPHQLEMLGKVLKIAAQLGTRHLRVFAGFASDAEMNPELEAKMLDALRTTADAARKYGIHIAVETHGGVAAVTEKTVRHFASYTTRADNWQKLFSTGAGMLFDPANLDAVGQIAPELFYSRFASHITLVHLKDFRHTGNGVVPVACGEGGLDWGKLHEAMGDYAGPALIEYENPEDVEDGFRRSLNFLQMQGFLS